MIRVSDYIAEFLYRQGVKDIFMLSGSGSIYLNDGVACNKKLNYICVRNEVTAPMMAEAYAKVTRNLGAVYVTTGPGGANAVSGVVEAWVDSAPIIIVSGQVEKKHTTYNAKIKNLRTLGTQELNIIEIVKSITKFAVMINDPEKIRYYLEKAAYLAKQGRSGPVWLDIPLDIQAAYVDKNNLKPFIPPKIKSPKDTVQKIDQVMILLKNSKKPLIVAGQGIKIAKAEKEFNKFINQIKIPVIFSRLGQDLLPFSHPLNMGHGGTLGQRHTALIMKEADLVISLGSRLSVQFIGKNHDAFSRSCKIVMVDIDQAELLKPTIKADLQINADVKKFLELLINHSLQDDLPNWQEWLYHCQNCKHSYPQLNNNHLSNPIDLYYFLSRLDALSNSHHIIVNDAGSSYFISGQVLRFERGQKEINSGTFASMGVAIPLAIGSSVADKRGQILAVVGDGSLELNIQELKTMSYYNLNIKLFVINNGGYASIRNTQDGVCDGRYIGSDQGQTNATLNLKKVAAAFELPYMRIDDYKKVDSKIKKILKNNGPVFIEVICNNNQKIIIPIKNV